MGGRIEVGGLLFKSGDFQQEKKGLEFRPDEQTRPDKEVVGTSGLAG